MATPPFGATVDRLRWSKLFSPRVIRWTRHNTSRHAGLASRGKRNQQRVAVPKITLPIADLRAGRFRLAHDHVFELFQPFVGYRHIISPGLL
jgi:hypothetical protein